MSISASDFQRLFNRRPASATIGLSIAAVSFVATLLQNLLLLLTKRLEFVFDFVNASRLQNFQGNYGWRQVVIIILWSLLGLLSCYLALEPRNTARFSVLTLAGVKLLAIIAFSDYVRLRIWFYLLVITVALLPIILLLTPASNRYYGRNR